MSCQIFAARPMFPQIQTTPLAGSTLTSHLRALLLMFGTYRPPTSTLNATSVPPHRATRVPQDVLTDSVVEEIKTRCCFVGESLDSGSSTPRTAAPALVEEEGSEIDFPPSDSTQSGSEFDLSEQEIESATTAENIIPPGESHLQALASMYLRHSTATDIEMKVRPPPSQEYGTGRGTLIIPGWVRERAAELLFEGGDIDESSLAETILDALLRVCLF